MTSELRFIIAKAVELAEQGVASALVTMVHLEGSSYRLPGVRMLVAENGQMQGALSGGCVEQEILRQSQSVFLRKVPKMITYNGRYRLGCEGILYILIEPLRQLEEVYAHLVRVLNGRKNFEVFTYYRLKIGENEHLGSKIRLENKSYYLGLFDFNPINALLFRQVYPPLFQLYIFGIEHDAVQLCRMAVPLGWQLFIIGLANEHDKRKAYFPDAHLLETSSIDEVKKLPIDEQTAIVLMSHNFAQDLQYLVALCETFPAYFGLLGPQHRANRLIEALTERLPQTSQQFLNQLRGPAGLDIGSENAAEIAIAILAEIMTITRQKSGIPLRKKTGRIHE